MTYCVTASGVAYGAYTQAMSQSGVSGHSGLGGQPGGTHQGSGERTTDYRFSSQTNLLHLEG